MPITKWQNYSKTRTYYAWRNMRSRCYNPKHDSYPNYGEAGIKVCDRWRNDYDQFVADMGECPPGLTLDRIDGAKGYSPENCRWATVTEQMNNRRVNRFITHNGETMTIAQWAKKLDVSNAVLWRRIQKSKRPLAELLVSGNIRTPARCGIISGYNRGCRCAECSAAYERRKMAKRKTNRKSPSQPWREAMREDAC